MPGWSSKDFRVGLFVGGAVGVVLGGLAATGRSKAVTSEDVTEPVVSPASAHFERKPPAPETEVGTPKPKAMEAPDFEPQNNSCTLTLDQHGIGEVRVFAMNKVIPTKPRLDEYVCLISTGNCESMHLDMNVLREGRRLHSAHTLLGPASMESPSKFVKVIRPFLNESLVVNFSTRRLLFTYRQETYETECATQVSEVD